MSDRLTLVFVIISVAAVVLTSCADDKDKYRRDWTLSGRIATSSGNTNPCLAVDSNDIVHIAWEQSFENSYRSDIYYTNSANPEMTVNISNTGNAGHPQIAVTGDQVVYISWQETWDGAPHAHIANSTDWAGTLTNLSPSADLSTRPLIGADPQGVVHAIWVEKEVEGHAIIDHWIVYANSTDWSSTKRTIIDYTLYLMGMAMAVDSNGVVHVVCTDIGIGNEYDIFYVNSTNWSATPVNVSSTDGCSSHCSMVVDSNDVVHIFWEEYLPGLPLRVCYANSTDWAGTMTNISGHVDSLAIDQNDVIHAVWSQYTDNDTEIFHANSTDWFATQTNVSNTTRGSWWRSQWPAIAVDSIGVAHIVWEESFDSNNSEVWYTHFKP